MSKPTSLTNALYRYSFFFFVAILISSFVSFWRYYYSVLLNKNFHYHIHAGIMTLWLLLLVAEAYLIRLNYRKLHRRIGQLSYLLAPAVVISIVVVRHFQAAKTPPDLSDFQLFFIALNLLSNAPLFALSFGLAIYYRRDAATHARFMVSTVFTVVIGPILTRFFRFYVYPYTDFFPSLEGKPMPMDVIDPAIFFMLACLSIWDWKAHRQFFVFPLMLGLCVSTRLLVNTIYTTPLWRDFAKWFVALPLS